LDLSEPGFAQMTRILLSESLMAQRTVKTLKEEVFSVFSNKELSEPGLAGL